MIRAIQCRMLNTWTLLQTTPEFEAPQLQRAAVRAARAKGSAAQKRATRSARSTCLAAKRRAIGEQHSLVSQAAFVPWPACGKWGPITGDGKLHPQMAWPVPPGPQAPGDPIPGTP